MRTCDLITELQRLDPDGTAIIDRLHFIDRLEGYWDGPGVEVTDNVYRVTDKEDKIRLYLADMSDALEMNMRVVVDIQSPQRLERYRQHLANAEQAEFEAARYLKQREQP